MGRMISLYFNLHIYKRSQSSETRETKRENPNSDFWNGIDSISLLLHCHTHSHTPFHRFSPPIHETLIFLVPLPGSEDLGLDWAEVADAAASPLRKKMEGGKRITVSPRPCCGRRIVAAKKRPRANDGFVNSVKKLQRREISSKRDRAFTMSDAQERFRNIRLQVPFPQLFFCFAF